MLSKLCSLVLVTFVALTLVACGGSKKSGDDLVWCAAPGEVVDAKFRREYPELHMKRAACDAVNRAATTQ